MHLKFYLFSLFIFLGIQGQLFAQNPKGNISGQVFDTKGEVLLFANVRLLNTTDSSLVSGAITNAEGFFQIEGIEKGAYWLSASQVGYQTIFTEAITLAAGQSLSGMLLVLPEDVQQLQSVEVVAKKQLIEQKPDKIVMNVENSIIGTGMNAAEVLKRAPGVTVDRDGSVGLKGRDQVLVLMDDKPLYLNAAQVGNLLKSLPANQIQSIEIITNPSAKYDAAGNAGIINIKLKKGAADGFNGSVNLNYGQGYYPKATGGFSLNYQKMGWRVTAHYDLAFRQNFDDATLERRFNPFNGLPQTTFLQRAGYRVPTLTHTFKTTLDYTWRDKNTLTLHGSGLLYEANWRGGNLTRVINDAGNLQELYLTTDQSQDYWRDWNGGMAYVRRLDDAGSAWSVEVDGKYYDQANRQNFVTQFVDLNLNATAPNFVLNGRIPTLVNQLTWKTDFTKVISPVHKIEAGLKGLYVNTDSDIRYLTETGTLDSTQSNFFSYKENIHAAYFSWRGQWQKWGLQVGLRAEHTLTQGLQRTINSSFSRDYLNLFPNVGLQYKASANHEWNLQYSRRIDRPDYQNLNPFQYFFDAFSIYAGNPFLLPQFTHNVEFSHSWLGGLLITTLNYSFSDRIITDILTQEEATRTTIYTIRNLNTLQNYGISWSLNLPITPWWNSTNYFYLYENNYQGNFQSQSFNNRILASMLTSTQTFSLPAGFELEVAATYESPNVTGLGRSQEVWMLSLGLQKRLMKDQLALKLNCTDVFWTYVWRERTTFQNINTNGVFRWDNRVLTFSMVFNFGNQISKMLRNGNDEMQQEDKKDRRR